MNHPGRATGRPAGRERECTPRRSREQIDALVLDLLAQSNGPIGAYDLAGRASAAGEVLVPNQVYRTLHRLIEQGLVHRNEVYAGAQHGYSMADTSVYDPEATARHFDVLRDLYADLRG